MKKTLLTLLVLALVVSLFALPAQAGGRVGGGLQVYDGEFGFQVRKDFHMGGDISQITGQLGMIFPPDNTIFTVDADYHFVIKSESGTSRFYPLVGIDLKFDSDNTEFGINAGGGVNFMLTDRTAAFAELKYVFADWDELGWAVGIYF